jgi:hypothetical protein
MRFELPGSDGRLPRPDVDVELLGELFERQ